MLDAELDQVLDPARYTDLSSRTVEELRALRRECSDVEDKVSYLRRLVFGRMDIVLRELARRAEGSDPGDLAGLIDELNGALADNRERPGHERMVGSLRPPDIDEITAELDARLGPRNLTGLPELSDDEIGELADRLTELGQNYSERRRALFERIDALLAELTRRYGTGEATVESVLR